MKTVLIEHGVLNVELLNLVIFAALMALNG